MRGWIKGDLKIYIVVEESEDQIVVCSELVDLCADVKVGNRTGKKYITWAGETLYLGEAQADIGEPRNKLRRFTYALGPRNEERVKAALARGQLNESRMDGAESLAVDG